MKYDPALVSYADFLDMLIEHQSEVRCCSVMPTTDTSSYEYLPEQAITKGEFEEAVHALTASGVSEDVGKEHVDCAGGACPVDFSAGRKAS